MVSLRQSRARVVLIAVPLLVLLGMMGWALASASGDGSGGDAAEADSTPGSLVAEAGASAEQAPTVERIALEASAARAERGAAGGRLMGRVVDEAGKPVPDARVILWMWGGSFVDSSDEGDEFVRWRQALQRASQERVEAVTDTAGRFALLPRGGETGMQLRILARGYLMSEDQMVRPSDDMELGDFTVRRAAIISGKVIDAVGRPIAGARVAHRDEGGFFIDQDPLQAESPWTLGQTATTDAEGAFELAHLAPGKIPLRASHVDYPAAVSEAREVAAGGVLREVTIVMDPADTVSGRAVGLPAKAADLRVFARRVPLPQARNERGGESGLGSPERSATLAPDGSFTLRGLAVGKAYRVWLGQLSSPWGNGNVACSQVTEVMPGARAVELRFEPGASVVFRVVDAVDGAPIEQMWIVATAGDRDRFGGMAPRRRRYPDGRVELNDLRVADKQTLSLTVGATGHARFERAGIELPRTGRLDLGDVKLTRVPSVRVQVLAAGQPVERALVRLQEQAPNSPRGEESEWYDNWGGATSTRSAWTDAQGRCVLSGVAEGRSVKVGVSHFDHAPAATEPLELGAAGLDVVVTLVRGGAVLVTAVDAEGKPLVRHPVAHRAPDGQIDHLASFTHGRVRFERLAPGEHRFKLGADDDDAATGWTSVVVVDGQLAEVELRREPLATLVATVTEGGQPLSEARVVFMRTRGNRFAGFGRNAQTDAHGAVTLADLAQGRHALRITHAKRAMAATVPITLVAGNNALLVELDRTGLRGVVRDDDGKPVVGAAIRVGAEQSNESGYFDPLQGGGGRQNVKTDAEGRFELLGVEAERALIVSATAEGFATGRAAAVTAGKGVVVDAVDVTMQRAGRVILIFDPLPQRARVTLTCLEQGAETRTRSVDAARVEIGGLQPGRWRAQLRVGGEQRPPVEFAVSAGAATELRM